MCVRECVCVCVCVCERERVREREKGGGRGGGMGKKLGGIRMDKFFVSPRHGV